MLPWNLTRELAAWMSIAVLARRCLGRGDALLVRRGTFVKQLGYRVGFLRTFYNRQERLRLSAPGPAMPAGLQAGVE